MAHELPAECDVAIIGAGPAGLAAAAELRECGAGRVIVLDREPEAGGIPRHCNHPPYGLREFRRLMRGPAYAARLVQAAWDSGALIYTGATVTALHSGPRLTVSTAAGVQNIVAGRVLLATGVRESSRAERLIGGTKPGGVLSTGALQGLVHLRGMRPFQRPLLLGSELVAFSALLTCRKAAIRPVAMVEPCVRTVARWPAALLPRMLGIPLHLNTDLVAIHGEDRVREVVLRGPDGKDRSLQADGVIVSGRFVPEATLLRMGHLEVDPRSGGPVVDQFGRCSDPAYFAAGNLLRPVETAGWSWEEGCRAGRAITASLRGALPPPGGGLQVLAEGAALKYVLPQRLVPRGCGAGAADILQLRVTRPVAGRLVVTRAGAEIWSGQIRALPERRLTVPIAALPVGETGTLTLRLEERAP
ncbi:NAD(P)/FAD-dependent oxidoreductase [Frigidibacter sp.]|uniref:NAD(P)/FAD-dependent oxidoreductase n=1 Tax=Frigidibacter sp. TaxID=2586418 RepID=UPI002735E509|nr:FAD/NAD(P)-binding oxidoreductase [Frigidibacter sp.]MDP3340027.1 FAD/NAD(P)-binding oxidoreductase [Frigidibacter sp.]